ncbi:retropepsin-like aspartic protease [Sulfuritalea sp.]|uniref:retropepsin-like aspartic protease n=1 Tax=Sulfuritalea sp. TaxID=2480090 RepID=UPI001AD1C98A|nr:retropepsin-like domain-containing protein [Sulfuritalea sp.]
MSGFAPRAQLPSSQPTTTNTANGVTNTCLAKLPELSFGNFRMTNVDVIILPRVAGGEALLNMNVLRMRPAAPP